MARDFTLLDDMFDHDVAEMLTFSKDTWLPELQDVFLKLGTAIRLKNAITVTFLTHRIRGCAAMGGADDIVAGMSEIDALVAKRRWIATRARFHDTNLLLLDLARWVAQEYGNLAS
ncbi:MAG TPA: hypothetical protein VNF68_04825 [Candidatus Baltobacteraceae bacterium]|nr:hypothetical protein [Candidatus Baltobacteraceae bacterium]